MQPLKTDRPSVVTDDRSLSTILTHPSKAELPTLFTDAGTLTTCRSGQPRNAASPISDTLSGTSKLYIRFTPAKKLSGIIRTFSPNVTLTLLVPDSGG